MATINARWFRRKHEAAGDRTQDPQIKSLLLYQLSYGLKNYPPYFSPERTSLFYVPHRHRQADRGRNSREEAAFFREAREMGRRSDKPAPVHGYDNLPAG